MTSPHAVYMSGHYDNLEDQNCRRASESDSAREEINETSHNYEPIEIELASNDEASSTPKVVEVSAHTSQRYEGKDDLIPYYFSTRPLAGVISLDDLEYELMESIAPKSHGSTKL